jgi:hypothetical protein
MMERVLGPLPKHMIARAEYVSFVMLHIQDRAPDKFVMLHIQDRAPDKFRLNFHSD